MNKIITTFTDFDNREWKDRLHGGKGDEKTPEDFDHDDVRIGTAVEREHSSNPDISTEIAIDHLSENPHYYDELIASGIADEEEAINLYDELKDDSDRENARNSIRDFMGDEEEEDDDDDYEEDDLGTDKADVDEYDDEMINDEYPDEKEDIQEKINYRKMEKSIKNYKSFVNETADVSAEQDVNLPGPERKITRENKYKFQLPYNKKVEKKLTDYNFTLYVPEGEKSQEKNFIIIDVQNLTYSVTTELSEGIRQIDESKLKTIFENL